MQPTTMTDIKEMKKNTPDTPLVADRDPTELAEVTTAPQEQLDKLDSETPKQPIKNDNVQNDQNGNVK